MTRKAKKIKPGLGKGLGALIPSDFPGVSNKKEEKESIQNEGASFDLIKVSKVHFNPYQPRQDFDEEALQDLADSINEHGVIQPITVRRSINGFELISGERRLRASIKAEKETIPAYILDDVSDVAMLEMALIENVQREDLNPIEVAHGYQRLIDECKYTQEEIAQRVSKDRSSVANFLRMLRLPENIQEQLRKKKLAMGHAKALLGLSDQTKMIIAGQIILEKKMTVRQTEQLVRDIEAGKYDYKNQMKPKKKSPIDNETRLVLDDTENKLRQGYGTKVKIVPKSKESGKIEFEFYSKDDLDRILDMLYKSLEQN